LEGDALAVQRPDRKPIVPLGVERQASHGACPGQFIDPKAGLSAIVVLERDALAVGRHAWHPVRTRLDLQQFRSTFTIE